MKRERKREMKKKKGQETEKEKKKYQRNLIKPMLSPPASHLSRLTSLDRDINIDGH